MIDFGDFLAGVATGELDGTSSTAMTRFKSDPCSFMTHERQAAMSRRLGHGTVVSKDEDCQELFTYLRKNVLQDCGRAQDRCEIKHLGRYWRRDTHGIQMTCSPSTVNKLVNMTKQDQKTSPVPESGCERNVGRCKETGAVGTLHQETFVKCDVSLPIWNRDWVVGANRHRLGSRRRVVKCS